MSRPPPRNPATRRSGRVVENVVDPPGAFAIYRRHLLRDRPGHLPGDGPSDASRVLLICGIEQRPRALGADDRGSGDGRRQRPCSARSWAVRTLMLLTTATAASVEPGPTGVSTPSMATSASAWGVHRSMTRSASSARRSWRDGSGPRRRRLRERGYRDDAQTASACATRHLDRDGRLAACREDDHHVTRPEAEVGQDDLGQPGVRSMAIAWRWPFAPTTWVWKVIDSSTIGLNPGTSRSAGTSPRPGSASARPEQVDEAARADRVGAPRAGLLHRVGLGRRSRSRTGRASSSQASTGAAVAAVISTCLRPAVTGAPARRSQRPRLARAESSMIAWSRSRRCGSSPSAITSSSASSVRTPAGRLDLRCCGEVGAHQPEVVVGRTASARSRSTS